MNARAFRRSAVAIAAFSASAIVLAGCAGGSGNDDAGGEDVLAKAREIADEILSNSVIEDVVGIEVVE